MKKESSPQQEYIIPDKKKVWNAIQREIASNALSPFCSSRRLVKIISIAALLALLTGSALAILFQSFINSYQEHFITTIAPIGQKAQLLLPDSTVVWLNSGSCLTYSTRYNIHDRIVRLNGEAFFEVEKRSGTAFVVETGDANIRVHGTKFNVGAYKEEDIISVALLQGSVSILASDNKQVFATLIPNQLAVVTRRDHTCRVQSCDAEMESLWRLNRLKFENQPIDDVWKKLSRWYGVDITVKNAKNGQTYWFTVKTETLTELLERVNKLTPIEYIINGEEVTISYK